MNHHRWNTIHSQRRRNSCSRPVESILCLLDGPLAIRKAKTFRRSLESKFTISEVIKCADLRFLSRFTKVAFVRTEQINTYRPCFAKTPVYGIDNLVISLEKSCFRQLGTIRERQIYFFVKRNRHPLELLR